MEGLLSTGAIQFLHHLSSKKLILHCFLYKTATTSAVQLSVELSRLGESCKMFQSWLLPLRLDRDCFKTVAPSDFLFLRFLVTWLGPSHQSSTQCQQTFRCCTICLVWLALGARDIPYEQLRLQVGVKCL